jgi:hypothetical protein
MRALLLAFLAGCSSTWSVDDRPSDYVPPPGAQQLDLFGPSTVARGETYTWYVRGPDLAPGTQVTMAWGGENVPGPCPFRQRVGGTLCLYVDNPTRPIADATAVVDPAGGGVAVFQLTAPPLPRRQLFLQAISVDGPESATSIVQAVELTDPPACPGGSATLITQADVDAYAGCTTLDDIDVPNGNAIVYLDLPLLESVTNDIVIRNQAVMERVSLPKLRTAGALRIRTSPLLTSIQLTELETINGSPSVPLQNDNALDVSFNDSFEGLYLPVLTSIVGRLDLLDNPLLTAVDAPALTTTTPYQPGDRHGVEFRDNPSLVDISMPLLADSGDFILLTNAAVTDVSMPALQTVDGRLSFNNNDALVTIDLPLVTDVTDLAQVDQHALLESVSLPALETVGTDFFARDNLALVDMDPAAMTSVGGTIRWTRNPVWCVPDDRDRWDAVDVGVAAIANNAGFCP